MPKNPQIFKSKMEARDAFIRDVQAHRNYIRDAFNKYGKALCNAIGADYDKVEARVISHDISKYKEEVESAGLIAFYYRYPNDGYPLEDSTMRRHLLDKAMLNHYHLNSCHPEYWLRYKSDNYLYAIDMDNESIVEMILDWIAIGCEEEFDDAGAYWAINRNKKMMSDETIQKVDILMDIYDNMRDKPSNEDS